MKVRFKVAWQYYRVGDEIDPPGTLASWLLANGYVDRVKDEPKIETATLATPETADFNPQPTKRKRGRPRKRPLEAPT
jgi:hypothetical protein